MRNRVDWDFSQRFIIRASTMLLFFSAALVVLATADSIYLGLTRVYPGADDIMWRFGVSLDKYLLIGAALSLGFLLYTLYRKKPQVQFLLEIIFFLTIYLLY